MRLKLDSVGRKLLLGTVLPSLAVASGLLYLLSRAVRAVAEGTVRPDNLEWATGMIQGGAAGLIVLVVLSAAFTLGVVQWVLAARLHQLREAMRRAEEGDFLVRVPETGGDEVAEVAGAFNHLLSRLTDLRAEEIDQRRSLHAAQAELVLQETLKLRIQELTLLYEMARQLTSTLTLEDLLERIIALVHEKLGIPLFSVMLIGEDGRLEVRKVFPPDRPISGMSFAIGEGACGRAAEQARAVYIPDVGADSLLFVRRPDAVTPEIGSILSVPMVHAGTLLGVLNFERPETAGFDAQDHEVLAAVADLVALAVRNARLHEETIALSLTDPLTGLANRRSLFQRLEVELARSARFSTTTSVVMIDIDRFKHLNDVAGHRAGDDTLHELALLLRAHVRRVDALVRYGGEEFMVVLSQVEREEALEVAEKLRRMVEEHPFTHAEVQEGGRITISVGVASFPADAGAIEALVDRADAALYASKRNGRNRVTGFEPGMEFNPGRVRGNTLVPPAADAREAKPAPSSDRKVRRLA